MAVTHSGWAVRLRLPRWDHHAVERLAQAGIDLVHVPESVQSEPVRVTLALDVESDAEARTRIMQALRGWTILLPLDFVESSPN